LPEEAVFSVIYIAFASSVGRRRRLSRPLSGMFACFKYHHLLQSETWRARASITADWLVVALSRFRDYNNNIFR
jgi:hypothetical protein